MLDDWGLVDKKQVIRNNVSKDEAGNWTGHHVITLYKTPRYGLLDFHKIMDMTREEATRVGGTDVWDYLHG